MPDDDATVYDDFEQRRIDARDALLAAVEAFIRANARAGLGALRRAYDEWACLGRGGE